MIYRMYKIIGEEKAGMQKTETSLVELKKLLAIVGDHTSLAVYDDETNTIQIFNDGVIDVVSIVQAFKVQCSLPDDHKFNIVH